MSEAKGEGIERTNAVERADELQREIQALSGRDLQLWSIGLLVIVVLTSGMLALLAPNVFFHSRLLRVEENYLPQLLFGLTALILLFNIYVLSQKRALNMTRRALIRELVLNERLENLSLIDPLTGLLNRRAMSEFIPKEVTRANRTGSPVTFMMLDLKGFRAINQNHGEAAGNELLVGFAKVLRETLRGGDLVFRQGGDEFLVIMCDTSEEQAESPVQRLTRGVEQWNLNARRGYEMAFTYGLAEYITGTDYNSVLRTADRKMYQKKNNLVPVF
jgi:diguanylate cyclase (GGDEF)-like protein